MPNITKFILSAVFLLFAVPALAKDNPPPLAEFWTFTPNAGENAKFWKAFKEHIEVRKEAGDPWAWGTYTPLMGTEMGRVSVRYCCFDWEDVDAYRAWNDEHPDVGEHWNKHVAPHVAKVEHNYSELGWNNSHWEEDDYRLFGVTSFKIKASAMAEFDAARDKMSQIALDQGWAENGRSWAWSTLVGGTPTESIVVPYRNFAEMKKDGESFFGFLSRVLKSEEAAAALLSDFSNAVWSREYQIWEYRPEFSMKRED